MSDATLVVSVPTNDLRVRLAGANPDVSFIEWDLSSPAPLGRIDIVVPPYMGMTGVLPRLKSVTTRLVQSQSVGYDGVEAVLPRGVVFANAASVHETSTAELAVALMLASQRGIDDFVRASARGRWEPRWHESLADHVVLLVGYGGVGQAIERRLEGFELTIVRVARTDRSDDRGRIYGVSALPALLATADVVVVSVPLDESTRHLVNDEFLTAMADGALLVNVARGGVADTDALVSHARSGRLRLALDVTDPEPLPAQHALFGLTNVLISPHVGGATSAMLPRMARLLQEQINRMRHGEAPHNVVIRT